VVLGTGGSLGNTAVSVTGTATFQAAAGTSVGSTLTAGAGATLSLASGTTLNLVTGTAGGSFTLNQGSSFVGTALTLSGATIDVDLGTSSADEIVATSGSATANGTNTIAFTRTAGAAWTAFPVGTTFIIANVNSMTIGSTTINTSTLMSSFAADQAAAASAFSVNDTAAPGGGETWAASAAADSSSGIDIDVTVTNTPEPGLLGLVGVAALGLLRRHRHASPAAR
jgi:MYXO-CTERM domain-containing protein